MPTNVTLRLATEEDAEACARVVALAMEASSDYGHPDRDEVFQLMRGRISGYLAGTYHPRLARCERAVFVAEELDEIVGVIAGHRTERLDCNGELQWAFVLPRAQGNGIGRALFGCLRGWFELQEITRLCVNAPVTYTTRAFYEKLGAVHLNDNWLEVKLSPPPGGRVDG